MTARTSWVLILIWASVVLGSLAMGAQQPAPANSGAEHPWSAAERLLRSAQQNELSETQAAEAAALLQHPHPFVRGLAEWALAMKVGHDNNGQELVWPRAELPAWFRAWSSLEGERLLECDWARQALEAGLHRDVAKLQAAADALLKRAERMAEDFRGAGLSHTATETLDRQVTALQAAVAALRRAVQAKPADGTEHAQRWLGVRRAMREVTLANPALRGREIVFLKQFAPHTVRNITRTFAWQHKPGGDICILTGSHPGAPVRQLLAGQLGPGHVRGLDVWWDADRVVFGFARQPHWPPHQNTTSAEIEGSQAFELRKRHEPIHLFEMGLDGRGLRQRTDDPYWNDFEPTYCPNGDIVFCSDRCARAAECGPFHYDIANANLYAVSPQGAIRLLTDHKDVDRHPHLLDNGRVAYTHWEYQERHFMEVHAVWSCRPDGRMADALFKQHMSAPYGLRDTRSIPDSHKLVSIATGHHTFAQGPVVVVDPHAGLNATEGLRVVTPGVKPQEGPMAGRPVDEGGVADQGGLYQTPWALSEKCFLVSYAYARPKCRAPIGADANGFALYLIDVYGNRELLHRDLIYSCCNPIPVMPRPRPPVLPELTADKDSLPVASDPDVPAAAAHGVAFCYLADVYEGLPGVPRGEVKYLRIAQHVPWPLDPGRGMMPYMSGNAYQADCGYCDWAPVRVIGTVPVASDGSAYFQVPADVALYFQALDERHMEIRRMRSMVSLKPGEVRGCRGCHESQATTPVTASRPSLALREPPQAPVPPPWGADRLLGYTWLVQPILDQHCVRCHGRDEPKGRLDFTATVATDGLAQSFRTMFGLLPPPSPPGRKLVAVADRFGNASVSQPKQFGSHRSPLVKVLLQDDLHQKEVRLSEVEWLSLVTWIDANAPYFDAFINKRPANGKPRRDVALQAATQPAGR